MDKKLSARKFQSSSSRRSVISSSPLLGVQVKGQSIGGTKRPSARINEYPYYEGPNPPLGYSTYNAKWQLRGLNEPICTISDADNVKRCHRFVGKLYGILVLNFSVMCLVVGFFILLTNDNDKISLQQPAEGRTASISTILFVVITCLIVVMVFIALYHPLWRRRKALGRIVFALTEWLLTTALVWSVATICRAFDDCERPDEQRSETICDKANHFSRISALDLWIGLMQLDASLFLVILVFCRQPWARYTSLLGFLTVMTLYLTMDTICVTTYFMALKSRMWPGARISMVFVTVALWIYVDVRRMMTDERIAVTEKEFIFAAMQLTIDTFYFPCFAHEATRRCLRFLVGACFIRRKRMSQDAAHPKFLYVRPMKSVIGKPSSYYVRDFGT